MLKDDAGSKGLNAEAAGSCYTLEMLDFIFGALPTKVQAAIVIAMVLAIGAVVLWAAH